MRVTSTPASVRPAAKASTSAGPESRMSCPTTTAGRAPPAASGSATTRANAAPTARATSGFSWSGTVPRTSYALIRWDRSVLTGPDYRAAGRPPWSGPRVNLDTEMPDMDAHFCAFFGHRCTERRYLIVIVERMRLWSTRGTVD